MQILQVIKKHQVKFRHTFGYRFYYNQESITLSDQEEACKAPRSAYYFARLNIPGTDIQKCQEAACKDPFTAYRFGKHISGADVEYCRKAMAR